MTIASYKFSEEISYFAHEYCFFLILNLKKMLFLTVCSCHDTYTFQSESTLYGYLNVKELLARSRNLKVK